MLTLVINKCTRGLHDGCRRISDCSVHMRKATEHHKCVRVCDATSRFVINYSTSANSCRAEVTFIKLAESLCSLASSQTQGRRKETVGAHHVQPAGWCSSVSCSRTPKTSLEEPRLNFLSTGRPVLPPETQLSLQIDLPIFF